MAMKRKLRQAWTKALESGKYKQAQGTLCRRGNDGKIKGYCCLGVLAHVAGAKYQKRKQDWGPAWILDGKRIDTLDGKYLDAEFSESIGLGEMRAVQGNPQNELAVMNDDDKSFKDIAKWIRKNL